MWLSKMEDSQEHMKFTVTPRVEQQKRADPVNPRQATERRDAFVFQTPWGGRGGWRFGPRFGRRWLIKRPLERGVFTKRSRKCWQRFTRALFPAFNTRNRQAFSVRVFT